MKKLLKKIDWWIDINLVYLLFNGNKMYRYHNYLEQKWGVPNTTIREKITELNVDAVMWDGVDDAIIGMSDDSRVVYSIPQMIDELQKANNWSYETAEEWVNYNIISAYVGEFTPIYIYEF